MMSETGETKPLFSENAASSTAEGNEDTSSYKPPRSKTGPRVYYVVLMCWVFLLLLLAAIALGSFGRKQNEITSSYKNYSSSHGHCILFVSYGGKNGNQTLFPENYGVCGFVFWGLASLAIVGFSFLVYLVVLTVFGTRLLSGVRLLEFVVCLMSCLAAFVLSVTITAGINKTCSATSHSDITNDCSSHYLIHYPGDKNKKSFYDQIVVTQNSCWASTVFWFIFCVWNLILVLIYMKQRKNKRSWINEGVI